MMTASDAAEDIPCTPVTLARVEMRRNKRPKFNASQFDDIIGGVKAIYREKIRPLEEQYMVKEFHYPLLSDDDFEAKPMVLLVGSYSTGKVRAAL